MAIIIFADDELWVLNKEIAPGKNEEYEHDTVNVFKLSDTDPDAQLDKTSLYTSAQINIPEQVLSEMYRMLNED